MMTPERNTVADEENVLGAPLMENDVVQDSELEDVEEDDDDEMPSETMQDEPSAADINNSINTSVDSENCKIINESDQTHSPCPDPEGVTTVNVFNGVMDGDEVVPAAANLTPVKLDAGLKEQETFTSSPTNSRNDDVLVDDEVTSRPLSRRQQRLRIVRCYGAVAIIVMVLAIGIPLGAVMIFKSNSSETSFAGANDGSPSSTTTVTETTVAPNDMRPPEPPIVEEEEEEMEVVTEVPEVFHEEETEAPKEVTQAPEVVVEDLDDEEGTTDPPVDLDNEEVEIEFVDDEPETTQSPFFDVGTEAPFVPPTDADAFATTEPPLPLETDANLTNADPFGERNVTSGPNTSELTDAPEAITDAPEVTTDAPEVTTDAPEVITDAPEVVFNPTGNPTWSPTWNPTASPTYMETPPQSPPTTPGPDRSVVYFELINVTSPAVLQDTSTPQALSYLWLVEQDQLLPVPSGRFLLQRYILVVMDHVLNDPVRPVLSQPTLDHCLWDGVVCDLETGDVKAVNWRLKGLNGRLVEEIKHLDSLERLDLSENELHGPLDTIYGATQLKELYLHNNKFSGSLSEQIGWMENLEKLHLGYNELTGYIPLSLRSGRGIAKPLKWLILSHNKFTGYLPPDWRMRNLFYLDLGHNQLSGPLPNDWDVNMVRLRHLYLDHNSFTGLLPAYFGQLGNGRLKQLHLNDNFLEGKVPDNWDPLDQVTNIAVHNNNLTVPLDRRVCELSVFELGVLVELRTDCDICTCDFLCEMCVE